MWQVYTLPGHSDSVVRLQISDDGAQAISGGDDGTVRGSLLEAHSRLHVSLRLCAVSFKVSGWNFIYKTCFQLCTNSSMLGESANVQRTRKCVSPGNAHPFSTTKRHVTL